MLRKIFFLIFFCNFIFSLGNLSAQVNIDSLKHILSTSADEEVLAYTYNDFAFQFYLNKPDTAIYYAEKALELALKNEINTQIYSAYNVIGLAYQIKGQYQVSLDYFNKQLPYLGDNKKDKAKFYHNMGITYRNLQNNSEALQSDLKAAALLEEEKDSLTLGTIYLSIANIYRELTDFELAEKYILNAIDIFNKPIDMGIQSPKSMLGNCYSSYGNLFQKKGEISKAIENHNTAINLYREGNDLYNLAISYENLGDDYALTQNHQTAILNYTFAKDIFRQINSGTDVGYEFYKIADVLNAAGNYLKAHNYADSALQLFTEYKVHSYILEIYKLKYEIYDEEKNHEQALAFYKKYNILKDSLNVESQKTELLRLKEEFETTQKEQQIVLLATENTLKEKEKQQQIVFRNIAIAVIGLLLLMGFLLLNRSRIKQQVKQLQMRNNIAIDLHDEVGSSLSSIKMLSEIASAQKENNNQLDEILQKINNNAKETAEKMHDIIWMINPKHDQLENILQRMEKFLYEMCSPKNIQFEFLKETDTNLKLNMQQRKNLLLIFKEAVNNAVKYSGANKISIQLSQQNNFLNLIIQDNGTGFDIKTIQPGNGLDSMRMRAEELNGIISLHSAVQDGTKISLQFPL